MNATAGREQYDRGLAEYEAGRVEAAVAHVEKAVELDPQNLGFREALGLLYIGLGRLEDAKRVFVETLEIDYQNSKALGSLGYISSLKGDLDQSIYYYSRALEIEEDAYLRGNLGAAYHQLGWYTEALEQYDKALSADPGQSWIWQNKARALLDQSRFEEAEHALRRAIQLEPEDWTLYQGLGDALMGLGRAADAKANYEKAVELTRSEQDLCDALGSVAFFHERQDDYEEAVKVRQRQIETCRTCNDDESEVQTAWDLAWDLYKCGRFEEAVAIGRDALAKKPGHVPMRFNLGLALLRLGRKDEAKKEYRTAMDHLEDLSDLEEHGIADLRDAIRESPDLDGANELLGWLEQEGRRRESVLHERAASR